MVPFEQGQGVGQAFLALSLFSALSFSCDPLPNIIVLAIYVVVLCFIQMPILWDIKPDAHYLLENFFLVIVTLIMFLLLSMLITKVAQTRNFTAIQQKSNLELLNWMSQSLIVFKECGSHGHHTSKLKVIFTSGSVH